MQQIDYLTSAIDLNEEEQCGTRGDDDTKPASDSSSSSGSSSSKVTVSSTLQRPSKLQGHPGTISSSSIDRRDRHSVQLGPVSSGFSSERSQTLRLTCRLSSSSRQGGPYKNTPSTPPQLQNLTPHDCTLSAQRNLPVRPPTPGLSPLTVNLNPPGSPGSQPHSPTSSTSIRVSPTSSPSLLSTKPHPPPVLSPSVIIETKVGYYQTPQSDHPSVGPLSPLSTPSASCPPTDSEIPTVSNADRDSQASSAGSVHGAPQVCSTTAATVKPPSTQGRKGRKPPPYPHHRISEHTKKGKEACKAPPYPEKRRLLSTTV